MHRRALRGAGFGGEVVRGEIGGAAGDHGIGASVAAYRDDVMAQIAGKILTYRKARGSWKVRWLERGERGPSVGRGRGIWATRCWRPERIRKATGRYDGGVRDEIDRKWMVGPAVVWVCVSVFSVVSLLGSSVGEARVVELIGPAVVVLAVSAAVHGGLAVVLRDGTKAAVGLLTFWLLFLGSGLVLTAIHHTLEHPALVVASGRGVDRGRLRTGVAGSGGDAADVGGPAFGGRRHF